MGLWLHTTRSTLYIWSVSSVILKNARTEAGMEGTPELLSSIFGFSYHIMLELASSSVPVTRLDLEQQLGFGLATKPLKEEDLGIMITIQGESKEGRCSPWVQFRHQTGSVRDVGWWREGKVGTITVSTRNRRIPSTRFIPARWNANLQLPRRDSTPPRKSTRLNTPDARSERVALGNQFRTEKCRSRLGAIRLDGGVRA
ncbi:hypothetical protein C8R43DRAFT_959523 [Mycena crocata]|nr:hypothetical protein C8R43DRAFT_959523 [Mycena crocata]